jgi:transposase
MTPRYARSQRGRRAVSHVPFRKGTNVSVLAAMNSEGVMAWHAYDGAVDGERFIAFLIDKLLPRLRVGDVVVMDNVRFHKLDQVKQLVEGAGARLCFIPPYHPELNAAEELFSVLKHHLRRREARSLVALVDGARDVFESVGGKAAGFVRHALRLAHQPS